MKRILGIAMVLGLMGVVTGTAQEADTAPSGVGKSSTPSDKMQRAWLWREGTKFTGTTLVFTSDKKIAIKPSKEKLHIYSKNYGSNWGSNGSALIFTPGHMYLQGPDKTIGEDFSFVTFEFKNLKVDGSEMTGTCTFSISYGFKGDKELKKLKGDNVPVKFTSSDPSTNLSNQPNPNNAGQPGDPKIPKDPLTPSEKFDQDVLKEIQNLIKDNPGKTDLDLQQAAEKIRKKGDSPKWVAVEHYFFAVYYTSFLSLGQSPTGMTAVIPFMAGMSLNYGWDMWEITFGNAGGVLANVIIGDPVSRWPGPRGDFRFEIWKWGTLGTMGWRP